MFDIDLKNQFFFYYLIYFRYYSQASLHFLNYSRVSLHYFNYLLTLSIVFSAKKFQFQLNKLFSGVITLPHAHTLLHKHKNDLKILTQECVYLLFSEGVTKFPI